MTDWNEHEDAISDAISDSIDMDWTSRTGAKAVVAWLNENAAAPAAPQAAGVGEREAIARIMDPKGWETRDRQYDAIKRSTMHDKDRPLAFANADYYTRDSLTKADAILALRAPSREPEGGAVSESRALDWMEWVAQGALDTDDAQLSGAEIIQNAAIELASIRKCATREEAPASKNDYEPPKTIIEEAPAEAVVQETLRVLLDNLVIAQSLSKELRQRATDEARSYLSALRAQPQAREDAQPVGWLRAADEEMVCAHLGVAEAEDSYETAKKKLASLIQWNIAVAMDPSVGGRPAPDALRVAVEALEPFAAAFRGLSSRWEDHETHWQDATSPIAVEDLRRAAKALAALQAEQKGGA